MMAALSRKQMLSQSPEYQRSSKDEDGDKIGRFGIGFKSVYLYTDTPFIWSPTISFKIKELILPVRQEPGSSLGNLTRFRFPFNSQKKSREAAYEEVSLGLRNLSNKDAVVFEQDWLGRLEYSGYR